MRSVGLIRDGAVFMDEGVIRLVGLKDTVMMDPDAMTDHDATRDPGAKLPKSVFASGAAESRTVPALPAARGALLDGEGWLATAI